jgi:hypothetical protein
MNKPNIPTDPIPDRTSGQPKLPKTTPVKPKK